MDSNNNSFNTIVAIALSIMVIVAWQFFYVAPRMEAEQRAAEAQMQTQSGKVDQETNASGGDIPSVDNSANAPTSENIPSTDGLDRAIAVGADERLKLETDLLTGSINLRGARIDDLSLRQYRQTIDPASPLIVLLSPQQADNGYFAEFGFAPSANSGAVPTPDTIWSVDSGDQLGLNNPVVLSWTNGTGVKFKREIAIDDGYMFTINDSVENTSSSTIDITPYGRIVRFGIPEVANFFVLHEGMIGVLGEDGLQEIDYDDLMDDKTISTGLVEGGWLGITDKFWGAALIPGGTFKPTYSYFADGRERFQTDFLGTTLPVAAGSSISVQSRLFAGAKKTYMIDAYEENLGIDRFELMIDWGWFHFITKPLFKLLNWLFLLVGNFGFAILITTVIVKAVFFPLANMSYASMAKMKKVQPEMMSIRERFAEDKVAQQKEMMALYKREKINPAAGCWPILVQIPVFFALYKVIFVTIEMRHAPFVGWIQDLAAPDPTSVFNLFGLLPFEVGGIFMIGVWPLLMGITMFLQMQMNPAPPDPTQAMIFKWMPIVFTFMLASFPAGLIIYWAWNNFLSILQQGFIMRRHGAKIELLDNLKGIIGRKKAEDPDTAEGDDKKK